MYQAMPPYWNICEGNCDLDQSQTGFKTNRDHLHVFVNACTKFDKPMSNQLSLSSRQGESRRDFTATLLRSL